MSESGIYIRVDKNNVLLEDLDLINRNEWLNGLDKAGLIRTINILCKVLHESNEKIKTYEDPEDLTLMFMYCDEKVKDKIKGLNKQLEENEEEIKKYQKDRDTNTKRYLEVKDYIKSRIKHCKEMTGFDCCIEELEEVLQRI